MATVQFENIKKVYAGDVQVIHGVNIDVADGEFIVIVGPSGCGKSTLLRMVAGLETVTEGEIRIGDKRVNELEPADRDIAMVFQNYALYPHMSVFNNMAYGLKNRGMAKPEIKKRVERAAEVLELGELLNRRPKALSGGQRQRVAMGRAIVREPQVFLFDEPLSNLDAKLRVQMRLEIKRLQRELGITAIYVTHDQVEAMTLADRLVVMNGGIAEQIGAPLEVYEKPATTYVGGFIGSPAMNFLPGTLSEDRRTVTLPDGDRFDVSGKAQSTSSTAVTVGIRPENLKPSDQREGALHMEVALVEQLGADTVIHGNMPGDKELLTVRVAGTASVLPGTQISLVPDPGALHLFNAESGARLG